MTTTTKPLLDGAGNAFNHVVVENGGVDAFGHAVVKTDGTPVDPATEAAQTTLNTAIGAVTASPATYTVLDRLKALLTGISLAASTNVIGKVGMQVAGSDVAAANRVPVADKPRFFNATVTTLTRPANTTAYTAGDSISDSATAGSVTALSCTPSDANDDPIAISELLLDTTDTGLAAGIAVRAYLYNSDPTASSGVGAGDNVAFSNKRAGFIGSLSGTFRAFSDGGKARLVPDEGTTIITSPATGGTTIWVQYQVLAGFTPSANSTTIAARLKGFQGRA